MVVIHKKTVGRDPIAVSQEDHGGNPMQAALVASGRLKVGGTFRVHDARLNVLLDYDIVGMKEIAKAMALSDLP